jgi:hypothetical protein
VLAPVLCSLVMIGIAAFFEFYHNQGKLHSFKQPGIILLLAGASVIFVSFVYDYSMILVKGKYIGHFFSLSKDINFIKDITSFVPDRFQWELFVSGMILILTGVFFAVNKITLNKAHH